MPNSYLKTDLGANLEHNLGADIGYYDDLDLATSIIKSVGGNFIQIFVHPTKKYMDMYKKFKINSSVKIVIHASYTYNFCRDWDEHSWWIVGLLGDIKIAKLIGVKYIVLHFGKSMGLSKERAYNNMYTALLYINSKITDHDIQILLETPAGQGTEICYTLEDISYFYNKIKESPNKNFRERIKICVDTCHVYEAGYSFDKIGEYFKYFDKSIGLENIKLIHLNDSKYKLGLRKDRHEELGKGYIGIDNIVNIYKFVKKLGIPVILETPGESYKREIKKLLFS